MPQNPPHITVTEAMRLTGYTRAHIYNLLNKGLVFGKKIWSRSGPLILLDRSSLLEYCRQQERQVNVEEQA